MLYIPSLQFCLTLRDVKIAPSSFVSSSLTWNGSHYERRTEIVILKGNHENELLIKFEHYL